MKSKILSFCLGFSLALAPWAFSQVYTVFQPGGDLAGAGSTWNSQIIANNAITTAKINNSAVDLTSKVTGLLPNANLANSAITINGTSTSLGGTRTLSLSSSDFVNQGTTTSVLHGNAAGNPSFAAVSLTADVSNILPLANGGNGTATPTANPTASVALSAVNGTATTYMRSDAAPALSQGIAPTWTQQHIYSAANEPSAILMSANSPVLSWLNTGAAANVGRWRAFPNSSGTFCFQAITDNVATATSYLCITRNSTPAITNIDIGNSTDNPAVTLNGSPLKAILSGTTGSIGGGALLAGQCSSGTVSISGATTGMVALADPNTYPGDGTVWDAQITSANTATVKVCAIVALSPGAATYNVRVLQ